MRCLSVDRFRITRLAGGIGAAGVATGRTRGTAAGAIDWALIVAGIVGKNALIRNSIGLICIARIRRHPHAAAVRRGNIAGITLKSTLTVSAACVTHPYRSSAARPRRIAGLSIDNRDRNACLPVTDVVGPTHIGCSVDAIDHRRQLLRVMQQRRLQCDHRHNKEQKSSSNKAAHDRVQFHWCWSIDEKTGVSEGEMDMACQFLVTSDWLLVGKVKPITINQKPITYSNNGR